MHPEVIPGFPIHSYGMMLAIAFFAAYFLSQYTAKKEGIGPKPMADLLLYAILLGIVGSRLFYVIQYQDQIHSFWQNFAIWEGGLVFYGGLIAAIIGLIVFIRLRKLPIWRVADACAPAVMIGLCLGRIGCFLNGCCWGDRCDENYALSVRFPRFVVEAPVTGPRAGFEAIRAPEGEWQLDVLRDDLNIRDHADLVRYVEGHPEAWRELRPQWWRYVRTPEGLAKREVISGSSAYLQHLVQYPKEIGPEAERSLPVHPTQLYSSLSALVVCGVLLLWRSRRRRAGEVFALLGCLYPVGRFFLEGLRNDTNPVLGALTIAQVVSVGMFAVALSAFIWCRLHPQELDSA